MWQAARQAAGIPRVNNNSSSGSSSSGSMTTATAAEEEATNPPCCFFTRISPPFPTVTEDGKIDTVQFLEASRSFIQIYDLLSTALYIVKKDMSGNIEKLYKTYNKAPEKYKYLNDLIYEEQGDPNVFAIEALLWLKRALQFTVIFINGICAEYEKGIHTERVDHMAIEAYNQTLKQYHMWLVQNLFKVVVRSVPYRSVLVKSLCYGKTGSEGIFYKEASAYNKQLETNLRVIVQMYDDWGLNSDKKV